MIKNGDILCGNLQHLREVYGIYQVQICVGFESILWSLHCGIYEVYSVYNRVCRVYIKVDSPSLLLPLALYLVFSFLSGLFSIFSSFYFFLSSSLSLSVLNVIAQNRHAVCIGFYGSCCTRSAFRIGGIGVSCLRGVVFLR